MKKDQRTSTTDAVSDGLAELFGRMVKDAVKKYRGGTVKAELAKGHPDFVERFYKLMDDLANGHAIALRIMGRPIWKTIQLGAGPKTAEGLCDAIQKAGGRVSNWAYDVMSKSAFTISDDQPTKIDLIIATAAELGFPNGATLKDIYDKALEMGLSPCPPKVGPELRRGYMDQPEDERLLIAMKPIVDSNGDLNVFSVEHHGGGYRLRTRFGSPDSVWYGDLRWVFSRRKKQLSS